MGDILSFYYKIKNWITLIYSINSHFSRKIRILKWYNYTKYGTTYWKYVKIILTPDCEKISTNLLKFSIY